MTPQEIEETARFWKVCSRTVRRWEARYGSAVVSDNGKLARAILGNIYTLPGSPTHVHAQGILGFYTLNPKSHENAQFNQRTPHPGRRIKRGCRVAE